MENFKENDACPTDQTNGSVKEIPRIVEENFLNHAVTIDKIDCTLMNQQKEFELIKFQLNDMSYRLAQRHELELLKFQLNELSSKLEQRKEQQSEMSSKLDQVLELVSIKKKNGVKINKTRDKSDIHNNQQFELQQDDERIVFQGEEFERTITEVQNKEDEDIEVSFEIL